ncbi:MAG: hypothetical protein QF535_10670, partial [Anaerolineales bacterium]|nr:hypothetical protein [Anaerolineales bacterium]
AAQAHKLGTDIIDTAKSVYYLGVPSRMVIERRLPDNVEDIRIVQDGASGKYLLIIDTNVGGGTTNLAFISDVNIMGTFTQEDLIASVKRITIEAKKDVGGELFSVISIGRPISRVFVTSDAYKGDLVQKAVDIDSNFAGTGLEAGNFLCQRHADAASLSGVWKAWLSDDLNGGTDAGTLITDAKYVRLDDVIVANSRTDLLDGVLENAIEINEIDTTTAQNVKVWTGTTELGVRFPTQNCANWAGNNPPGTIGTSSAFSNKAWTEDGTLGCGSRRHLYCFEQ